MNEEEKQMLALYENNPNKCIQLKNNKCFCTKCSTKFSLAKKNNIYDDRRIVDKDEILHCCNYCSDCHDYTDANYCDRCKECHEGGQNNLDQKYVACPKCFICMEISLYSNEFECDECKHIFKYNDTYKRCPKCDNLIDDSSKFSKCDECGYIFKQKKLNVIKK
jgi:hypothetical protein